MHDFEILRVEFLTRIGELNSVTIVRGSEWYESDEFIRDIFGFDI